MSETFAEARTVTQRAQRTILVLAATWAGLGLLAGLAYRELTRHAEHDPGVLGLTHGHTLTLGMIVMLVVLLLERFLLLSASKAFTWFLPTWNLGLLITVVSIFGSGFHALRGMEHPAIASWVAGSGHILLTIATVLLFVSLFKALGREKGLPVQPKP